MSSSSLKELFGGPSGKSLGTHLRDKMYSSHDYKKMVPFFLEIEFTLHLQVPFFVLKQTMQKIMKNPGPTVDGSEIPNKPPWL